MMPKQLLLALVVCVPISLMGSGPPPLMQIQCRHITGPGVDMLRWITYEHALKINAKADWQTIKTTGCDPGDEPDITPIVPLTPPIGCDLTLSPPGSYPSSPAPGTRVCLNPGTYTNIWAISGWSGTPLNPIVIKPVDGSDQLSVTFSGVPVIFFGSSWVELYGIVVRDITSGLAGIQIRQTSHDILVANAVSYRTALGFWIADGAGTGNILHRVSARENNFFGIAVDRANDGSIIGSTSENNGFSGVQVIGNGWDVLNNRIFGNGTDPNIGDSGVSVFSTFGCSESVNRGNNNVIARNLIYENHDEAFDGSGIILDQFCDFNIVDSNVIANNDGFAIIAFDSTDDTIVNNSGYSNMDDPTNTHPTHGEVSLQAADQCNSDRVTNMVVQDSFMFSETTDDGDPVTGLSIDPETSDNNLTLSGNNFLSADTESDPGLVCDDGIDNDGDGLVDFAGGDPGCADASDASETDAALVCDDGNDNDGDGRTDFDPATFASPGDENNDPAGQGDPGCKSPSWDFEDPLCQDGVDNDGDGKIDYDAGRSIHGFGDANGPDPQCEGTGASAPWPWRNRESNSGGCGLGFELVVLLAPLMVLRRRQLSLSA